MSENHGRNGYLHGCRCDVCRAGQREYIRAQRARKRALRPVPAPPPAEPETAEATSTAAAETVGPVVAAVRAELATLGSLVGRQGLAAAAVAMARILDHPGLGTTQPAAARQLASLLDVLHREAAPQRGRLAVVQKMAPSSRPDAR
jgi:hypothetical protein